MDPAAHTVDLHPQRAESGRHPGAGDTPVQVPQRITQCAVGPQGVRAWPGGGGQREQITDSLVAVKRRPSRSRCIEQTADPVRGDALDPLAHRVAGAAVGGGDRTQRPAAGCQHHSGAEGVPLHHAGVGSDVVQLLLDSLRRARHRRKCCTHGHRRCRVLDHQPSSDTCRSGDQELPELTTSSGSRPLARSKPVACRHGVLVFTLGNYRRAPRSGGNYSTVRGLTAPARRNLQRCGQQNHAPRIGGSTNT